MADVTLADVVRALEAVINEVEAIKSAVTGIAEDSPPDFSSGTVERGIRSGQCPPPNGTYGTSGSSS